MRKSTKVISLLLSGLMATTCFSMAAVTASAAAVDSEPTGVMTEKERLAAGHELVYFKFPETAWGSVSAAKETWSTKKHTVKVYCNFYAIYGNKKEVTARSWEAPSTSLMLDEKDSDIFYFDITASKQIAETDQNDDHKMEPGAAYGILFSTSVNKFDPNTKKPNDYGYQTCDMYFDTNCIGDTYVVDELPTVRENTATSQKIDYYGHSLNGVGKPIRKITTLCQYLDGMGKELDGKTTVNGYTLNCVPDSLEMANRLKDYLIKDINEPAFNKANVAAMMEKFETNSVDTYWMYVERFGEDYAKAIMHEVQDANELKPNGTLKDHLRNKSLVKLDEFSMSKTIYYPYKTLVAERLGLIEPGSQSDPDPAEGVIPQQIKTLDLTLSGNRVVAPDNANYTVSTETKDGKLVTTVSPKAGYAFTAKPERTLNGFDMDKTSVAYDNGKTYIDAVDGKIIVTTDSLPDEVLIPEVALDIGSNELTAGKAVPRVTASEGANYTVNAVWEPANSTFAYDTGYTLTVAYMAKDGYYFDETTTCETELSVSKELTDKKHMVVTVTFRTDPAPLPDAIIGDIDGDGEITIQDATLIQRRGVEMEVFTALQEKLADVDGDGRVSILDVTCVQRYIAELGEGSGNTGKKLSEIA